MSIQQLLSIFLLLFFIACGSNDPFADCQYGRPQPVFAPSTPQVVHHAFGIKDMQGIEQVQFANETKLELIQKGCNDIIQEFTFELPGQFESKEDAFWIKKALEQFRYLSQLDEQYADLEMWVQAIGAVATEIKMGQKIAVQPSFFVKINRVISTDYAILTVEFSQGTGKNQ